MIHDIRWLCSSRRAISHSEEWYEYVYRAIIPIQICPQICEAKKRGSLRIWVVPKESMRERENVRGELVLLRSEFRFVLPVYSRHASAPAPAPGGWLIDKLIYAETPSYYPTHPGVQT